MKPKVDGILRDSKKWRAESDKLRMFILDGVLTEEMKWGKPCYTFQKSNILIIQGFREYCALMFCKGALRKDRHGLLKKPGESTQAARQMRTNVQQIVEMESILKTYIAEAVEAERTGLKVDFRVNPEPIPEELQDRLDEVPALNAAFDALTPGRQRGYILYFSAAKQSKTRPSRVEKSMSWILKGAGLNGP